MSVLYLLDTDTASYIIKGTHPQVRARLLTTDPSRVCISAITRAEILYGLKSLGPAHPLNIGVRSFFRIVQALPWNGEAPAHYAEIRHQSKKIGHVIGEMDMMIAAHSVALGAVLVSNNTRHFKGIPVPLMLQNWA